MKKVYVVGGDTVYASFIEGAELVDDIKKADIVLFTGGEDVTPSLYKAKPHRSTYNSPMRDKYEKGQYNKIKPNQLALGICRGSQFLCVMNGGKLVQDCKGHAIAGTHPISNGEFIYEITSTHHQMQYPYDLSSNDYTVLYKSHNNLSNSYWEGDGIDAGNMYAYGEPEIVHYHVKGKPQALAIQGHPEYMRKEAPVIAMLNDLINNLLQEIKK
jgi:hypothetical protein